MCFVYYRGGIYSGTEALKETIWLKRSFEELSNDLKANSVFCDYQSAIFFFEDQMFQKRVNVCYHFVHKIIDKVILW